MTSEYPAREIKRAAAQGELPAVLKALESLGAKGRRELFPAGSETPLHAACMAGQTACAEALARYFDPMEANASSFNALHCAVLGGHKDCAALMARLCPAGSATDEGETAAHIAARMDKLDVLEFLMRAAPQLAKAQDFDGWTPMRTALYFGTEGAVRALAPFSDFGQKDNKGQSPREWAEEERGRSGERFLAKYEAAKQGWIAQEEIACLEKAARPGRRATAGLAL